MDPNLYTLLKIFLALMLGGIVGYERERFGHFAGIRTHILVCLTSAFLISAFMNMFELDSIARLAAAIMTGIGFIGAGTILRHGKDVQGLTTAASVWAVAGLGIIIGIGMLWESVVVSLLAVLVLEMRVFALKRRRLQS